MVNIWRRYDTYMLVVHIYVTYLTGTYITRCSIVRVSIIVGNEIEAVSCFHELCLEMKLLIKKRYKNL